MQLVSEDLALRIKKWRKMGYEPHMIVLNHDGKQYPIVFRTLTKEEYLGVTDTPVPEEAQGLGSLYTELYKDIINVALLEPKELPEDLPATTDQLVASAIIEASGWVSTDKLVQGLEEARDKATSLDGFLKSRIIAAFPAMELQKIDSLRMSQVLELVGMSETITGVPVDLQPWLDPEGYQKRIDREKRMQERTRKEQESGMQVDPRMKDPEFRKKLIAAAQASRERLGEKHGKIDFDKTLI